MNVKRYSHPLHFKTALDERLKQVIRPGRDLNRVRQFVIFERFLARVAVEFEDAIVLKGGLVLEFRLARARTTKDVDVRFSGDPDQLLDRLQRASRLDLGDFMTFEVTLDSEQPAIQGDGAKYEGQRFRVLCKIAGFRYGAAFGLDVGIGDPMLVEPELITMPDRLGFIDIAPPRLRIYPTRCRAAARTRATRIYPTSR